MSNKATIKVSKLDAISEEVFNLLTEYKVLGDGSGKWLEGKKVGFKRVVKAHAIGWIGNRSLILSYPTCVRLIIDTEIINGEAVFTHVEAVPYPTSHSSIDYEALNRVLQEVIAK